MKKLRFLVPAVRVSAAAIDSYQDRVGVNLPDDYREFCLAYNGGCPHSEYSAYLVPDRFEAYRREFENEKGQAIVGVEKLYGILPVENRFSAESVGRRLIAWGVSKDWLALAGDAFGNQVFLARKNGSWSGVHFWDKDTRRTYPVADSCLELYDGLQSNPNEGE